MIFCLWSLRCSAAQDYGQVLNKLSIQVAPSGIMDINGRGLPIGLEYRFTDKWSVSGEMNLPFMRTGYNKKMTEATETHLQSDFRSAVELHYFYYCDRVAAASIGLQGFCRSQQLYQEPGFYREKSASGEQQNVDYSYADVQKRVAGAALIFDARVLICKRFSFSVMTGVGLKWSETRHSNMENIHIERPYSWFGNPELINTTFIDGHAIRPYIPVRLQVAFALIPSRR